MQVLIWREGTEKIISVTLGRLETVQISKDKIENSDEKIAQAAEK